MVRNVQIQELHSAVATGIFLSRSSILSSFAAAGAHRTTQKTNLSSPNCRISDRMPHFDQRHSTVHFPLLSPIEKADGDQNQE